MYNKILAVLVLVLIPTLITLIVFWADDRYPSVLTDVSMAILAVVTGVAIILAIVRLFFSTLSSTPEDSVSNRERLRRFTHACMLMPRQPMFLIILAALIVVGSFSWGLKIWGDWNDEWSGYNGGTMIGDGYCNIAVIAINGDIGIYGELYKADNDVADADDIVARIRQAEMEPGILGILMRIDSAGGAPVASRVIMDAMKRSSIPVVAVIREIGTSGAYMAASGAEIIFADPMSDVGDIGVTYSYVDNVEKNKKEGLTFVPLASAKYKDYLNPDKPLTKEERALIERDLKISHEEFVRIVAENRGLPIEDVAKLADGASMPGALALENKLIDALGDQESARDWFAKSLDMPIEEVSYCE